METTELNLAYLLPLRESIGAAISRGWSVEDIGRRIRLSGSIAGSPTNWEGFADLDRFAVFAAAHGRRREHEIVLHKVNHEWEIFSLPDIQPDQWFDEPTEVGFAKQVWERQTSALRHLGLEWTVELDLDLVTETIIDQDLQVNWDPASIDQLFASQSRSSLARLIPEFGRRTFVCLQGERNELSFGAVTFAAVDSLLGGLLPLYGEPTSLPGESPTVPSVAQLLFTHGDQDSWPAVSESRISGACALIWEAASSDHTDDFVEFFGYKRVRFQLPTEWSEPEAKAAARLRHWAFSDGSPDRILAIRQIISLYTDPPFGYVDEILASAEPIYFALRSDATAEALRDTRDAETHAQQAVRLASQSAVDLTKLAGERLLAALIAVGAAGIANVTKVLDDSVTTVILGFVSGYFAIVLTLFLLIDRRAVGLPIEELDAEIQRKATYLSPAAITSISTSPTVVGARNLVRTARIAIVTLYALITTALVVVIVIRLAWWR